MLQLLEKGEILILMKPIVQKVLLTIVVICVLGVTIFDTIPWILGEFGNNDFYNSQIRHAYNLNNFYILFPALGTLALIPLLIKNYKRVTYWILLVLLWFMFLIIIFFSILIMLRITPGV